MIIGYSKTRLMRRVSRVRAPQRWAISSLARTPRPYVANARRRGEQPAAK